MKQPEILIVTHKLAQEVDGVIDVLRQNQLCVNRYNLCEFPENALFSFDHTGLHSGNSIEHQAQTAWLHDVGSFSTASSLRGACREVSLRESSAFWDGALCALGCNWLNSPDAIKLSSLKLRQLVVAKSLGIPVPPYVATNNPEIARLFSVEYNPVIVKGIRGGFLVHEMDAFKFMTHRLSEMPVDPINGLQTAPLLFQKEIKKVKEIRVTVVDDKCFSVSCDLVGLIGNDIDIRSMDYQENRNRFSAVTNVTQIEEWSLSITRKLGLSYSGIDWVIDNSNEAYFLECNPLGSFKWSELVSGFDITGAIADALVSRYKSTSCANV